MNRGQDRVQLIRNVNALEGQPLLNSQQWEQVQRQGDSAIEKWIDDKMAYKRAVIVLIGAETAGRRWVNYEINKAWTDCRPLLGVRIHGLSSWGSVDAPGSAPFTATSGIPIYDPTVNDWRGVIDSKATYERLAKNLAFWVDHGKVRK